MHKKILKMNSGSGSLDDDISYLLSMGKTNASTSTSSSSTASQYHQAAAGHANFPDHLAPAPLHTTDADTGNGVGGVSASFSASMTKRISDFVAENMCDDGAAVLPWYKLLSWPARQQIVFDRMHSGARRYVTLDFGQPVQLTDVVIPACEDLVSLTLDMWCVDEEADTTRLLCATDIATKAVVLSDLQPPPVCRYVKLTTVGRYGITSTRCRIPIGQFFGHILVLDHDGYADPIMKYIRSKTVNLAGQMRALGALYEDVRCRYALAASKLQQLLEPLADGQLSNVAHMQSYLSLFHSVTDAAAGGGNGGGASSFGLGGLIGSVGGGRDGREGGLFGLQCSHAADERTRILTAYDECILYQHQLNVLQNVRARIRAAQQSLVVGPSPLIGGGAAMSAADAARYLANTPKVCGLVFDCK